MRCCSLVSGIVKGVGSLLFRDESVTSGGNFGVKEAYSNRFSFMQVTLTLPPDLITTLVAQVTAVIRRELAGTASPPAPQRPYALLTVKTVAGRLKLHTPGTSTRRV